MIVILGDAPKVATTGDSFSHSNSRKCVPCERTCWWSSAQDKWLAPCVASKIKIYKFCKFYNYKKHTFKTCSSIIWFHNGHTLRNCTTSRSLKILNIFSQTSIQRTSLADLTCKAQSGSCACCLDFRSMSLFAVCWAHSDVNKAPCVKAKRHWQCLTHEYTRIDLFEPDTNCACSENTDLS